MGLSNLLMSYKIAVTWYLQNKCPQCFYLSEFCKPSCKLGGWEWFSFLVPNNNFPYPSVCAHIHAYLCTVDLFCDWMNVVPSQMNHIQIW